jgi:glycosyltransferase involved in cell wall biosynthesis
MRTQDSPPFSTTPAGLPRYVLVTPARNERSFIEHCLQSVVAQTILPEKWIVVSDGSTDGTDDVVRKYSRSRDWIELLRMPERQDRHFAGKIHAFNAGYGRLRGMPFEAIASLDADISFGPDYFEYLLHHLVQDFRLGLVGTPFAEEGESYDYRFVNIEHVSGACQLFRRQCFEEIGGYVPLKRGGVDHVAVLTARMHGWRTRTFTERVCHHHRKQGSAVSGVLQAKFRVGKLDYVLGAHPVWEAFRGVYQISKRPFFLGSAMIMAGYFWSLLWREERTVSVELLRFRRREQMARLKAFFRLRLSH